MRKFRIGDIEIGNPKNVVVIPEIGINHGGSLKVAKEMVLSAYRSGAKIIKHQTHVVEDEMCSAAKTIIPGNADKSIYSIMAQCALDEQEELELKQYVESLGMVYLSTPFSRAAADRLEKFDVPAFKIGSGELNNYPLISYVASFGKPMIVSTGMNDIRAIAKTVNIMEKAGVSYALMHTTNLYPTLPRQVRLGALQKLMREFPDVPIGLSDHTVNNNACIAAMALGALLVERHYTDTKDREGPDIICSMDEKELHELLQASKELPVMLGGRKEAIPEEKITSDFAFSSVVTISDIKAGEIFTRDNIWVKRPGTGEFLAEQYESLLGKKASTDISEDTMLKKEMIG